MEIKMDCIFCGGVKKLYFNPELRVYHCFRCNAKGKGKPKGYFSGYIAPQKETQVEPLPPSMPVFESPSAMEYLKRRNIKPLPDWRFCVLGKYNHRIIFPFWENGCYMGFQARAIKEHMKPKYLTAKGTKLGQIVYGVSRLKGESCTITEGIFDSIRFSNGVAVFSKNITDSQFSKLLKFRQIFIAFDKDAFHEVVCAGLKFYARGKEVNVVVFDAKDPAEVGTIDSMRTVKLFDFIKQIKYF